MKKLLADLSPDGAVMIMRHGERPIIDDPTRAEDVLLTEEGVKGSRELGRELLADHRPRGVFFSTVPRFGQTARALLEGMRSRGAAPIDHGPQPRLAVPYLPDPQRSYAYALRNNLDSLGFIRAWFNGELEPELIQEPKRAAWEQLAFLCEQQKNHPGFGIHISHDWNILLLVWVFIGVEPSEESWPGFLEGLLIHFDERTVRFRFRNHSRVLNRAALRI